MRYKAKMEERLDTLAIKVGVMRRMVEGRVPADPQSALRVMIEIEDELQRVQELLSLE